MRLRGLDLRRDGHICAAANRRRRWRFAERERARRRRCKNISTAKRRCDAVVSIKTSPFSLRAIAGSARERWKTLRATTSSSCHRHRRAFHAACARNRKPHAAASSLLRMHDEVLMFCVLSTSNACAQTVDFRRSRPALYVLAWRADFFKAPIKIVNS